MAWTESGIYGAIFAASSLTGVVSTTFGWATSTGNYFFLTNNSDTPAYTGTAAAAASSYATTNEVNGTGWAAGGIQCSVAASGSATLNLAVSSTTSGATVVSWTSNNLSVASTTLSNAYGGYFYSNTNSPKNKIIGIYFGGSAYSTTAGTFAITWSGTDIATFALAS